MEFPRVVPDKRTLKHFASSGFWASYRQLPVPILELANQNFELLKTNPGHPSLQFKKIGGVKVMQRTYFTREEARREIGRTVEARANFPSVPKGSRGSVVKIQRHTGDKWLTCVEWHLPRAVSVVDAMVGDASLNFLVRRKAITDQFCRAEYETLLRLLAPEDASSQKETK